MAQDTVSVWVWLIPTLFALFSWGVGQGLVKKYISDVSPARFCLYFVFAKAIVNIGYFYSQSGPEHPNPFAIEGREFLLLGIFAYVLDGLAWIFYFKSIVAGPITIVGTLSAAYPALTVLFARFFLSEVLSSTQYIAIALVILACIGLAYDIDGKSEEKKKVTGRWVPFACAALLLWGIAQVIVKYAYGFPAAHEANMALFNTFGGLLTLGVYGFFYGRKKSASHTSNARDWLHSFLPMGMMAAGDLFVIIALSKGPSSVVTPVSGAYPLVTVLFAWIILKEKIHLFHWGCIVMILLGIYFSPGAG